MYLEISFDMITISDLQKLTEEWACRLASPSQPRDYKDALYECIYDLNNVINHSIEEELSYKDFLEQEADNYLASAEAHEYAA